MARKKGIGMGKQVIIVSSVIALNLVGVTYAYWNTGTAISSTASTGYINPVFGNFECNNFSVSRWGDNNLNITGYITTNETTYMNISIDNNGSVPFEHVNTYIRNSNGVSVTASNENVVLEVPNSPNTYNFVIELLYRVKGGYGWEKTLVLEGNITVSNPVSTTSLSDTTIDELRFEQGGKVENTKQQQEVVDSAVDSINIVSSPGFNEGPKEESSSRSADSAGDSINIVDSTGLNQGLTEEDSPINADSAGDSINIVEAAPSSSEGLTEESNPISGDVSE